MAKILIVDDNADVLHVMQLVLGSRGFEVAATTKGEDTYSLVDSFQPNLIFLDVHLAGMDGRHISRKLKKTEATKHIPIILFSANNIKGTTVEEAMADEFIAKPFDIHELVAKVNRMIGPADHTETMIA
jgi:CheY-like chemotaxis protein